MVKVKGKLPVSKAALKSHARMTRTDETAEAKRTKPAKQQAVEDQFEAADEAAVGDGEFRLRMAALGGL